VADSPGSCLGRHFVISVREGDRATEPVAATRSIGQMSQWHGELDLAPVLGGFEADGFVPPRLVLLPIGGDEQTRRVPAIAPLGITQIGIVEVVMGSGEGPPTPTDREPTFLESGRYLGEPAFEHLETPLVLKSLVARAVTPSRPRRPPTGTARRRRT